MAYLPADQKEQDNEQQGQAQAQGQQQPPVLGAPSAAPSQGSGQSAQQTGGGKPEAKQPSRSGSFTNLQNYVTANAGTDAKMGQAVGGVVGNKAGEASQGLEGWKKATADKINEGTVQMEEGFTDKLRTSPGSVDPNQYQQYANASYGGPQSAQETEGYADTQQKFAKVGELVGMSQGGLAERGQLLDAAYDRPSYSRGERNLDSFILGTGEGGKQELANIQDTYGTFGTNFTDAAKQIDTDIGTAKQTTEDTKTRATAAGQESLGALQAQMDTAQKRADDQNKYNNAQYQQLQQLAYSPSPYAQAEFAKQIGVEPSKIQAWVASGNDPMDLVQRPEAVSAGNFLDPTFGQQWTAINSLLGNTVDPSMLAATGSTMGTMGADTQALEANAAKLDQKAAETQAAKEQAAQYEKTYQSLQNDVTALAEFSGIDPFILKEMQRGITGQMPGVDLRKYTYRDPNTGEPKFHRELFLQDKAERDRILKKMGGSPQIGQNVLLPDGQ